MIANALDSMQGTWSGGSVQIVDVASFESYGPMHLDLDHPAGFDRRRRDLQRPRLFSGCFRLERLPGSG
jgi:hypothetical protein